MFEPVDQLWKAIEPGTPSFPADRNRMCNKFVRDGLIVNSHR
jgi:hypothetical protein